jgi:HSP20 family protein
MSTLLRRDPRAMFPDLVEWFEEPFLTLRPYLGQPIRIEDFVEGDHYMVRAGLAGIDPEKDVEVTVGSGYLTGRLRENEPYRNSVRCLPSVLSCRSARMGVASVWRTGHHETTRVRR